jgi:hypothetical protein
LVFPVRPAGCAMSITVSDAAVGGRLILSCLEMQMEN